MQDFSKILSKKANFISSNNIWQKKASSKKSITNYYWYTADEGKKPLHQGHRAGGQAVEKIIDACILFEIPVNLKAK